MPLNKASVHWQLFGRSIINLLQVISTLLVGNQIILAVDASNSQSCGSGFIIDPISAIPRENVPRKLVKFDPDTFVFQGLTEQGANALVQARDIMRERDRMFGAEFRNLDTLHHAAIVARLFRGHMFIYGPPGGAKSAFINWLMKGESEVPFKLQLHQMLTEQAFIGGQNLDAARKGQFEINVKGSMADAVVAVLDETNNGNPAALSSLQSLLNEREILAGNQVIKARLETLFATSNATLPEFFDHFLQSGQGPTAPALLNRFPLKAFVYNWLSPLDQARLDGRVQRRRYLAALAEANPEVLHDEVFLVPKPIDWAALRQIANALFKPSELFMTSFRDFINDMREQTNRAVRESEERHRQNSLDAPYVYFPSADYTERLRQQIPEIVIMSAFVDFMLSPLANDENIAHMVENPIELGPLSLWRAFLAMTTIGPGRTRLVFSPGADQKLDVEFESSINPATARDAREERMILNIRAEQERFRRTYLKYMEQIQFQIELRARHSINTSHELDDLPFELLLLNVSGG